MICVNGQKTISLYCPFTVKLGAEYIKTSYFVN